MLVISSSSFAVPDRHPVLGRPDPEIVVWLRGQHNASNERALCLTLARAIALGSPGLVLDLSEVRVMSSSTLAVIVRAREYLRRRSASLTVRSPMAPVRRLIDASGLNDLLGPRSLKQRTAGRESARPFGPVSPSRCPDTPRLRRPRRRFESRGRATPSGAVNSLATPFPALAVLRRGRPGPTQDLSRETARGVATPPRARSHAPHRSARDSTGKG